MNESDPSYERVVVPLSDVRYLESTGRTKRYEDGREVTFYQAAPEQYVRAYSPDGPVWAPVAGFSIHRGIRIVIVNLRNGGQIVTDHDPRAVFGVVPGSKEPERFYPHAALSRGVMVPFELSDNVRLWGRDSWRSVHATVWEALGRKAELLSTAGLGSRVSWLPEQEAWVLESHDIADLREEPPHPELAGVAWTAVAGVTYTNVRETGYDLTVPGYETFMSADGVILSNTMSVHVPSTPEAIKDVREKLMASKMLWSTKDREKTLANPKHEQVIGLSMQGKPKQHKFRSEQEAEQAIRDGRVNLYDELEFTS
jgi:hypothetical protein